MGDRKNQGHLHLSCTRQTRVLAIRKTTNRKKFIKKTASAIMLSPDQCLQSLKLTYNKLPKDNICMKTWIKTSRINFK